MPATATYSDDILDAAIRLAESGQAQPPRYDDSLLDEAIALAESQAQPAVEPEEHGVVGEFTAGLGRGALRVLGTPAYLADVAGEATGIESLERMGEAGAEKIERYIEESPRLRKSESITGDIRKNPQLWTDPRWYASLVGEGVPTVLSMLIPGLGAAKVAKVAGMGAKGIRAARVAGGLGAAMGLEAGGAAEQARQHERVTGEDIPVGKKLQAVMGTGIVAGSLEYVPIFRIFGNAGGQRLIARILQGIALEGSTEGAQEVVANAFVQMGYDPDQDMLNGVIESVVGGALIGGGMGTVSAPVTNFQQQIEESTKPENFDNVVETIREGEKENALAEIKAGLEAGTITPEQALESAQNPGVQAMGIANEVADLANEYTVAREAAKPLAPEAEAVVEPVAEPIVEPIAPAGPTAFEKRHGVDLGEEHRRMVAEKEAEMRAEFERETKELEDKYLPKAEQQEAERVAVEVIEEREAGKPPELKPAKPKEVPPVPTEPVKPVEPIAEKEPKPAAKVEAKEPLSPERGKGDASIPKSIVDGTSGGSKLFGNAFNSKTFRDHGFGGLKTPAQRSVIFNVLSVLHNPEIREAVIRFVPVDVVDNLPKIKSPSKISFHDKNVFSDQPALVVDDTVSFRVDVADSIVRSLTRPRTKPGARLPSFDDTERLATGEAGLGDSSGVVDKISTTSPGAEKGTAFVDSDSRRLSVKGGVTKRALDVQDVHTKPPSKKGLTTNIQEVSKKVKPGSVFIGGKQFPFREYHEFTKGKNEGKIQVTLPDGKKKVVEKADVAKWPEGKEERRVEKPLTIYRGQAAHQKSDRYYTPDKEWARQFTQSGQDKEISSATISQADIYKPDPLPRATSEKEFDAAVKEAKAKGFKAVWLDEGLKEPDSIYIIEKAALKPSDIDAAKSRIVSALKSQRGSFSMKQKHGPAVYEDLLTVGKHIITQGHTKWSGFRLRMKDALSEIWDKVRGVISRVFVNAKKILKSEKGAVTIEGVKPPLAPEAPYGYGKTKTMQEILDSINAAQKRKPTEPHKAKNVTDKVGAIYNGVAANWRTRTIDRLYPLMQKLDQGLDITDPDMQAYIQGRMDTSTPTVVATFLQHGKLKWLENAPYVETKDKGFLALTEQYGINPKAVDSYDGQIQTLLDEKIGYKPKNIRDIDRYLFWKVASRAEKLTGEGREHLFTKDDIALLRKIAGKDWKDTALDKQYVAFNKNVLDFAQQIGLIDPSMRRVWEHDEYIPFYRILEDELLGEEFLRAPIKTKKFIDSQIKKLVGGTEKLGDPFENILRNWSHLITESIRNRTRTTAYNYMEQLGYAEPSKPPKYIKHPEREAILNYMVKGKRKHFKVKDLELFNALSGANIQKFDNILMRMFGRAKRMLTYGATFGPAFRVANMLRDTLQTAMVNRSFVPVWDSLQGVYKAWTEHPDYVAMMSSGGGFSLGYVRGDDPQAMARHVRKVVRKAHKKSNTLSPLNLLEWWERVGSASENAARVQLYANLRKKGTSHLVAGFKARDVLDFSLSGDSHLVQTMIRTMPFLGARMQGLYKMGRAYGEDKSAFLLKGAILAGLSLAWWAGISDDDRYKELEDWEKWTYRHFWIGDTHFRLPRAFEVDALFSSSVESIADALSKNEEGKHVMNFIGQTMRDTFALDVPQLVRPLYEQAKNEIGFTGRPIISESLKHVKPEEQAQPWTSESLRVLGGKLGISPLRAEALVRGYLATLGMFILGGMDVATQWAFDFPSPPKSRVDNYPLLGRFVREAPARHTKYVTRFYEMANEMDVLVGTINHYKRTGDVEKAVKLARTSRVTLSYKKGINKIRLYLRNVNAKIKLIHYQKNLGPAQKKERINKLLDERNEMIKKAYESLISARVRSKK